MSCTKDANAFWESMSLKTKPHYKELVQNLFEINEILNSAFHKVEERYSFVALLLKEIKSFFDFLSKNNSDLNENIIKQLRKDSANLRRKLNQNAFQRKPQQRAKSHKSTMVSISKKIQCVIEEATEPTKKRKTISFDIFSAINGGNLDKVKEFVERDSKILLKANDAGNLPIHFAVSRKDKSIVEFLIQANPSVSSCTNSDGLIPLETAIMNNDNTLVKILSNFTDASQVDLKYVLHCDQDIRDFLLNQFPQQINQPCPDREGAKNRTKQTPMHKVSAEGRDDVLLSLLEAGGNPNVEDINGNTPLHSAVTFNNPNCVRTLVGNGANVDKANNNGDTPLITAVSVASIDTVKTLLDAGADSDITNNYSESPALLAVARKNKEDKEDILQSLINNEADVNQQDNTGYTPLVLATSMQDKKSVHQLLAVKDIDVDAATEDGFTALTFTAVNDDLDTAEKLLSKGADIEITTNDDKAATHYAVSPAMVDVLVRHGADINAKDARGRTPLFTFVQSGLTETALHTMNLGADLGAVDEFGNNVLHEAATQANPQMTNAVIMNSQVSGSLSSSFDSPQSFINHQNHVGSTPLHRVCSSDKPGAVDTCNLLLENGASLEIRENNGNLPIHHAARANTDLLGICLDKNPQSVNAQNNKGDTPLHIAADANFREAVERMVDMTEIDFEVKNNDGCVASEATGNAEISQAIALKRMAKQYHAKDGEIVFGLKWFDWNDLDIHLICACNQEISFRNRKCEHCELDVDMNVDGGKRITNKENSDQAVEHITFERFPIDGEYLVAVNMFNVFDTSADKCEYSVFMVQKDHQTASSSELVFFVKSSFENLASAKGLSQAICSFSVAGGKLQNIQAPAGKVFVNKLEGISLPLDYQSRPSDIPEDIQETKFLPKMRVIEPKDMDDD